MSTAKNYGGCPPTQTPTEKLKVDFCSQEIGSSLISFGAIQIQVKLAEQNPENPGNQPIFIYDTTYNLYFK